MTASSSRAALARPEPPVRPAPAELLDRLLRPVDALFNRVYGARWNPLYKSGALAVTFISLALVTGVYLFILYKVADPYGSVARLDATWLGSLMRSVHRYAADLAIVAAALHAFKMLVGGRTWGPRALAWITGIVLLGVLLLCGWTGLVMAWDVQGQLVAHEGAKLIDLFPLFSEPISRSFARPAGLGRAFFFMNLFLHVALPLGLALLFWLHASRVARAAFFPPRPIHRYAIGAVVLLALAVPVPLPPAADLLSIPADVPLDLFYAFWLPLARGAGPAVHLATWLALGVAALSAPWWWRPRTHRIVVSRVREDLCAGCGQCYLDCPYEAISMVSRAEPSELSELVARVDPALCLGCGICSGSCAPMGVGPAGRTGREQLQATEVFLDRRRPRADQVVLIACGFGPGAIAGLDDLDGVVPFPSRCSGSVHTSVIELLLRSGAGGVFVLTCPDRDCLYREGPRWLAERVYNDREAELQARVDRRRVRIASHSASETAAVRRAIAAFRSDLRSLAPAEPESRIALSTECEVQDVAS